jgi:hypothetical protein
MQQSSPRCSAIRSRSSPDSAVHFYQKCDPQDSERWGLHVDKSTMEWWDKQDPQVRAEAFSGTQPLLRCSVI